MILSAPLQAVRSYARRWGARVVRGGYVAGRYVAGRRCVNLEQRGIYPAPLSADYDGDVHSAIDVPNLRVLWPSRASNPYLMLHELTHLIFAIVWRKPVDDHDEQDALFTGFEYGSVKFLEAPGLTVRGWSNWRQCTSDADGPRLAAEARASVPLLIERGLFRRSPRGGIEPTFVVPA